MKPAMRRLALIAACLAGVAVTVRAEPVQTDEHAPKHAKKKHTAAPAHKPVHALAHAHALAHVPAHARAHKPPEKAAHVLAHATTRAKAQARKPAHKPGHASSKPAAKLAAKSSVAHVHPAARAAALAAIPAASPMAPRVLPKLAPANADPNGEGFLNLYVELCVKRIGEIDAFRDKLLRDKVPKLQPDSAKMFLSGMEGDAWPVPYQGKMGNFVLVLPAQKNLCMLYARRTDTAAVERGFAEMVAKAPEPMIATRGPETHAVTASNGATRTVSTNWAPPGSERKMQFILTTTSAPDAQVQAFGSVAIVVGPEPGPGPDKASASAASQPPARSPGGSAAPAPRPHAQP